MADITDARKTLESLLEGLNPEPGIVEVPRLSDVIKAKQALHVLREENERLRDYLQQWTVNDTTTLQLFQRLDAALAIAVALSVSHPHIGTPLVKALKGEK